MTGASASRKMRDEARALVAPQGVWADHGPAVYGGSPRTRARTREPTTVERMDIVDPRIEAYTASLHARFDEPVAAGDGGRSGRARLPDRRAQRRRHARGCWPPSIGARRVFELGSGFGYSALLVREATGPAGEIHLTDGDPANERKAPDYLQRAGLWDVMHVPRRRRGRRRSQRSTASSTWSTTTSTRTGYPDAWRAARDRVRVGGLYICDNMLWYGRVPPDGEPPDERHRGDPRAQRAGRRPTSATSRRSCPSATACWSRIRGV